MVRSLLETRNATQALEAFWGELAIVTPTIALPPPFMWGEKAALAMAIVAFGVPNFFKPRWMPPYDLTDAPANWTSFYDAAPVKA